MSAYRTSGFVISQPTGLPVPTGVVYRTVSGQLYTTNPVGEAPGGINNYPGIDFNVPGAPSIRVTTTGAFRVTQLGAIRYTQGNVGAPYGFVGPVPIGHLTDPP